MPAEFSRPLILAQVPHRGRTEVVEASAEECAALAQRFGIPAVDSLRAELTLAPEPGGAVRAHGRLRAAVVQHCVVTLEPVPEQVDTALELRFLPPGQAPDEGPDDPDEIEAENGLVDLGEIVAEELALALNPYPRHPDAALPAEVQEALDGPFAALRGLGKQ